MLDLFKDGISNGKEDGVWIEKEDYWDNLIILISKMKSDHPILIFLESLKAELAAEA